MARFSLLKLLAAAALFACQVGAASYNGLAVTPQMGWDNWNAFGCDISEDLLLSTAKKIVDYGYDFLPVTFGPVDGPSLCNHHIICVIADQV